MEEHKHNQKFGTSANIWSGNFEERGYDAMKAFFFPGATISNWMCLVDILRYPIMDVLADFGTS